MNSLNERLKIIQRQKQVYEKILSLEKNKNKQKILQNKLKILSNEEQDCLNKLNDCL